MNPSNQKTGYMLLAYPNEYKLYYKRQLVERTNNYRELIDDWVGPTWYFGKTLVTSDGYPYNEVWVFKEPST